MNQRLPQNSAQSPLQKSLLLPQNSPISSPLKTSLPTVTELHRINLPPPINPIHVNNNPSISQPVVVQWSGLRAAAGFPPVWGPLPIAASPNSHRGQLFYNKHSPRKRPGHPLRCGCSNRLRPGSLKDPHRYGLLPVLDCFEHL